MGIQQKGASSIRSSLAIVAYVFISSWVASLINIEIVSFLVLWAAPLVHLFTRQPVHVTTRVMLLLGLILEGPEERAGNGYWVPPFAPASQVMMGGINKWTGIPGASFSLFAVLSLILLVRARKSRHSRTDPPSQESRSGMNIYFIGVVLSVVWGLVRGGAGQPMFWQLVYPVTVAITTVAFLWGLRGKQDIQPIGTTIIVAAITKAILVAWVYVVVCRPLDVKPFYATTHSDSVTFASAFAVLVVRAFEERSKASLRSLAYITPIIVTGVYMNNRRLAFVTMGSAVLLSMLSMQAGKAKRRIIIGAIAASPLVAVYFTVGGSSDHPFFALAKAFSSVSSSSDSSSETRDIENYNLYLTLKHAVVAGTGFGHEYDEVIVADDISGGHPLYRYIPHNSVLWIVSVGGILLFHLLWFPNAMLAYMAYRAHRHAPTPLERAAGLACACMGFIFMFQAWGDMGISAYTPGMIFAVAYALSARIEASAKGRTISPNGRPPSQHPV